MKINTEKHRTRDEIVWERAKYYVEFSKRNIMGTLTEFKNCSLYFLAAGPTEIAKVKPEFLPWQIGLLFFRKENCALLCSRQRVVAIHYRRFGTTYSSHLQQSGPFLDSWPLNMGPLSYPETSVRNCHHSLHNNSEECSSYLLRGWSLKSHGLMFFEIKCFRVKGCICPDMMENYMLRISR